MWHCPLVICTPLQSIGLVVVRALFWCWVSLCDPFTISSWWFATIIGIVMAILLILIYIFGLSVTNSGNSGSTDTHLPGCFCACTFSWNIGLNMLPSDSFMSCYNSLLGYYIGEFQASQLIVLALFGEWIKHLPPVCWFTYWKSSLTW